MAAQKQAVELLKQECEALPERYAGYRGDAAKALLDVLRAERDAVRTGSNALTRVEPLVETLGDKLNRQVSIKAAGP